MLTTADAWLAPIVAKGNKFFDSDSGAEFRVKGMAYYPRPNSGKLSTVDNYDWASDEHEDVWKPHLKILADLGVNTLRLYSVDPSKKHDKFICENCSILDAEPPKCYPDEMFTRAQMVYNSFAIYDNTLVQVTKASDTGRYGIGYFDPENCDHDKVPCEFKQYPEYDNLKKAYSSESNSSVIFGSYTPERTAILECPKNVTTDLPSMPKVETLSCATTQPTCGGKTSNQAATTSASVALGDKKSPSNEATDAEKAVGGTSVATTIKQDLVLVGSTLVALCLVLA
ncbi:hypothetical protein BBO99_00007419 [Phytophthora kernoviae]|uniref:1,3-beta-glucanosyltransferase n=2 Tax=Phytophthora kernoviae TaxID=325452 RepID=A0A3R7J3M8_9STRA|nr:hypothetical protein G195_011526 [Phytophthora kernoviae 00238/432]KAG2504168.1 hypothetical protein JM16_009384 [Phytophthora kernoviae]KAG2515407.1 hypothetical protein JM18_007823 [Phytophthora kernoviae]RLN14694.1 hypothetical protein BBI17_009300 [Phytophthora kernoviae]RLN76611.1 hypothetical protein BBO99_00007419 [Phytophthora kernoviae]